VYYIYEEKQNVRLFLLGKPGNVILMKINDSGITVCKQLMLDSFSGTRLDDLKFYYRIYVNQI